MDDQFFALLERLSTDDYLSLQELTSLKKWMDCSENQPKIESWAQRKWSQCGEIESDITFEQIVQRVGTQYQKESREHRSLSAVVHKLQRVAAILVLPLILALAYLLFFEKGNVDVQYCQAIAPRGQKAEVVLPDNTHIWLNSGTQLRYPASFGNGTRDVFLTGEAYFEVEKDKHKPFIVHAANVSVKVLGTKFNVKAYADDQEIETALLSGKVNLIVDSPKGAKREVIMQPGDQLTYCEEEQQITKKDFDTDAVVAWKNNRLVFQDDSFENMVKKIERWYNVKVICDKSSFLDRRFTAELLEGESLDGLCRIIEKAIDVNCRIVRHNVYIKPKQKI